MATVSPLHGFEATRKWRDERVVTPPHDDGPPLQPDRIPQPDARIRTMPAYARPNVADPEAARDFEKRENAAICWGVVPTLLIAVLFIGGIAAGSVLSSHQPQPAEMAHAPGPGPAYGLLVPSAPHGAPAPSEYRADLGKGRRKILERELAAIRVVR